MNNDQFPKTIVSATDVLSNHRFDERNPKFYEKKKSNNNSDNDTIPTTVTSFAQKRIGRILLLLRAQGAQEPRMPWKREYPKVWMGLQEITEPPPRNPARWRRVAIGRRHAELKYWSW